MKKCISVNIVILVFLALITNSYAQGYNYDPTGARALYDRMMSSDRPIECTLFGEQDVTCDGRMMGREFFNPSEGPEAASRWLNEEVRRYQQSQQQMQQYQQQLKAQCYGGNQLACQQFDQLQAR